MRLSEQFLELVGIFKERSNQKFHFNFSLELKIKNKIKTFARVQKVLI
jgi:hypothetical protein